MTGQKLALVPRALLVVLLLVSSHTPAAATAQAPDVISLDGKVYALTVNPLEVYLSLHPDMRPSELPAAFRNGRVIVSTGNWRGYVAYWAVVDGALVLRDVRVQVSMEGETVSVMKDMWPDTATVAATWFTGHLIIPTGRLRNYVHMGYGSEYDRYIVLKVREGAVARSSKMNRKQFARFRSAQFAAFQQTDAYRAAVADAAKDDRMTPGMIEDFLYQYFSAQYLEAIFD